MRNRMLKKNSLLFGSLLMAALLFDQSYVHGEAVIYDPLDPVNQIEPTEPSFSSESVESSTMNTTSSSEEETRETTTETTQVKQAESSAEKKEEKKVKKKSQKPAQQESYTHKKITIEKNILQPDDNGGGGEKNMFKASELSYSLSGLAIYGKKAEGGVEIHVQNIFR